VNSTAASGPSSIVLDTNVVLDWLLFADSGMTALSLALQAGHVRWVACQRMRDEFEHTLRRPELARWQPDSERLLVRFDEHAVMVDGPASAPGLRCADATDQVFIDLAVHSKAAWLISHDRAVLRLRRRAAMMGLRISKPDGWSLECIAGALR
jgi:putative PIN family toxin of toxin-antitoxin system